MAFINENITEQGIAEIARTSFINYAMSVITDRSLPDVRDGLKPVQRRIAYGMSELLLTPDKPYKKSARIVGDVMGKYHPHGDSSIYGALVRLSQYWSVRNTLVDIHGNNGSVDGDGAAAMRYTEARMTKLMQELLRDLKSDTVDFIPNYDNNETEPSVLPALFPNLLVNGVEGIAVGMATDIPTHNLKEVIDGTIAMIDNPEISLDEIMTYIPAPDFPTGGELYDLEGVKKGYETGRGRMIVRSKVDIEYDKKGKNPRLIVTELPYQVSPEKLSEKIKELQISYRMHLDEKKNGKIVKETPLIDFLAPGGNITISTPTIGSYEIRMIIPLQKNANPELVRDFLYKNTPLQSSFSMNMVALSPVIDRYGNEKLQPKTFSLLEILEEFIKHRSILLKRKTEFDIKKASENAHRLEGIILALNQLDETIRIIRNSPDKKEASASLRSFLSIDEIQSEAILEMKLARLTSLDQDKQRSDLAELHKLIEELNSVLSSKEKMNEIIKADLIRIRDTHGDDRRTEIKGILSEFNKEDFINDDEMVITITQKGLIKRTPESSYRSQRRKGIGVNGMKVLDNDFVDLIHVAKNKETLLFFTNTGNVYRKAVYDIPENNSNSKGIHIRSFLSLRDDEEIVAIISVREFLDEQFLLFVTKNGIIKKTALSEYAKIRQNGITAIKFKGDDELISVKLTSGDRNVTLVSKSGMSITFNEQEVKISSRNTSGVKGIELKGDDKIVSFVVHEDNSDLLIATKLGFGKRTALSEFRVQTRGGKGMLCQKTTDKNGEIIGASVVSNEDNIMLITKNGTLMKLKVKEISQVARNTQGNKIINLRDGDILQDISRIPESDEEENELSSNE